MVVGTRALKVRLLSCAAAILVSAPAVAQSTEPSATVSSEASIGVVQQENAFDAPASLILSGAVDGALEINVDDANSSQFGVQDSTLTISGSVATAFANGQDGAQTINAALNQAASAGDVSIADASSSTTSVVADLGIAVTQQGNAINGSADNQLNVLATVDAVSNSSVSILGNTQDAIGIVNRASDTIVTAAGGSDFSTGIALAQETNGSIFAASVSTYDVLSVTDADIASGLGVQDSTIAVTGNTHRAIVVGNAGTNGETLSGNAIDQSAQGDAFVLVQAGNAQADAANAIASHQSVDGASLFSATAEGQPGFRIGIDGSVSDSTVRANSNATVASAHGNEIGNSLSLSANTVNGSAGIANLQAMDGGLDGSASGSGVDVAVDTSVQGSTVTASSNAVQAEVVGNKGSNAIAVSGSSILAPQGGNSGAIALPGSPFAIATFAISSEQQTTAGIQASANTTGMNIQVGHFDTTNFVGDVRDSKVAVDGNTVSVNATANLIGPSGNTISITGNDISATAAVANAQQADSSVAAVAFGVQAAVEIGADTVSSQVTVDGNAGIVAATGNSAVNRIAVSGNVIDPLADVFGHAVTYPDGSAVATYALSNIQTAGNAVDLTVGIQSFQASSFGISTSNDTDASAVTDSSLSSSNNVVSVASTANVASNSIALLASSVVGDVVSGTATGTAIFSGQLADAQVYALDLLANEAPVISQSSSIQMNGNANSASATGNVASNLTTVTVDTVLASTNTDGTQLYAAQDAVTGIGELASFGDFVSTNDQIFVNGEVNAYASSNIYNHDAASAGVIDHSSVTANANSVLAKGGANQSTNTMVVNASSDDGSAGVLNGQGGNVAVTAVATTTVRVEVGAAGPGAGASVDNSTITIARDTTASQAFGNSATNTLTHSGNALNGSTAAGDNVALSQAANATDTVTATFAVLNEQKSGGPITATTSANYSVAVNDGSGALADVSESRIDLTGNRASANAFGNTATNGLALNATNYGVQATAAIGSSQLNTGNVGARVTSADYSIAALDGSNGAVASSSLAIGNSALSANAAGNSTVSTLVLK